MKKLTAVAGVGVTAAALSLALVGCGTDTKTETKTSTSASATTSAAPTRSAQASGPNYTIADYVRDNDIVETPVRRGDPGAPEIQLPSPDGWEDAGSRTPESAYGAIVASDPAMADDPPMIVAQVSKMTGNADPAKILEFAPGEVKNLPGYEPMGDGSSTTLSGFEAFQFGGMYKKNGVQRIIGQKTVVIPGPGGLYVLRLIADGLEDQMGTLMDATDAIDQQTTIKP